LGWQLYVPDSIGVQHPCILLGRQTALLLVNSNAEGGTAASLLKSLSGPLTAELTIVSRFGGLFQGLVGC
jgi:hypothetical protein